MHASSAWQLGALLVSGLFAEEGITLPGIMMIGLTMDNPVHYPANFASIIFLFSPGTCVGYWTRVITKRQSCSPLYIYLNYVLPM